VHKEEADVCFLLASKRNDPRPVCEKKEQQKASLIQSQKGGGGRGEISVALQIGNPREKREQRAAVRFAPLRKEKKKKINLWTLLELYRQRGKGKECRTFILSLREREGGGGDHRALKRGEKFSKAKRRARCLREGGEKILCVETSS